MRRVCSDNLTLLPASQLPNWESWKSVAHGLPPGSALFVVPPANEPMKNLMSEVAAVLSARGRRIATAHPSVQRNPVRARHNHGRDKINCIG